MKRIEEFRGEGRDKAKIVRRRKEDCLLPDPSPFSSMIKFDVE